MFVLWLLVNTVRYSLYEWDGVAPARWVGLDNYKTVFTDHQLVAVLEHAFQLIIYFTDPGYPRARRRVGHAQGGDASWARRPDGAVLPQVVPLVAAGIA